MCAYRYVEDYEQLPAIKRGNLSFAEKFPELAEKWYYPLNRGFGPEEISWGSSIKAWWVCPVNEEHLWQSAPNTIVSNGGKANCPYCTKQAVSEDNSLQSQYPDLAKEWFTQRNRRGPDEVVAGGYRRKYWWRCSKVKSHIWQATIAGRINTKGYCPKCNPRKPLDLRKFPIVLKQFDKEKNKGINPHAISRYTKAWWKCTVDSSHVWQSCFSPHKNSKGDKRCPFCNNRRPSKTNNLSLNKKLAKEFHPTKNGSLKAKDFLPGSTKSVWWKCHKGRDHVWQTQVVQRGIQGTGCPYCVGQKTSASNSFATKNPTIAKDWHPTKNGSLTPRDITLRSTRKVWWQCPDHADHEWQAPAYNRRFKTSSCPFCKGIRVAKSNSLATKNPKITKLWDHLKNGNLKPKDVYATTKKSYWFTCLKHESYLEQVFRMKADGSRCPRCRKSRKKK